MAETASNMIPLGSKAPSFTLTDTRNGQLVSLENRGAANATVIMFLSNHCPYVKHIQPKLVEMVKKYQSKNIDFIGIASNDIEKYPEDGPEMMKAIAEKLDYTFPYLFDQTQAVAKAYKAACTPDFYVFDKALRCVYRGCFDESTPGNNKPLTGEHLAAALDALLAGQPINPNQKPSLGCNIKWISS